MLRWIRIPLGFALILLGVGRNCSRPVWMGLGRLGRLGASTPQGSIAMGLGALYAGAGMYNERTAIASSINEDTWQRWNQYLYLSNEEATRKYMAKKNFDIQKNKDSYNAIIKRLQDNPTAKDVTDGDALERRARPAQRPENSGLFIANRRTRRSPPTVIGEIPFRYASEAVTIILSQVKGATKWPAGARRRPGSPTTRSCSRKSPNRRGRKTKTETSLRRRSAKAHALVGSLRAKLEASPLADSRDNQAALRFVKTLAGLVRLLEKPDTREALDQLRHGQDHDGRQPDRVHARSTTSGLARRRPPVNASSTSSSTPCSTRRATAS